MGPLVRASLQRPGVAEVVYVRRDDALRAVDVYHNRQLDGLPMHCSMGAIYEPRREAAPSVIKPRCEISRRNDARYIQTYFIFDILFYLECLLILASPTLLQTLEPYTRRYLTRRLPAIRKFSPLLCPRKMRESLNLMVTFIHFVFLAWHFFPSFFSLSTKKKLSISFSFVYFLDENTVWKNSH